jgi:hypothetical protein
MLFKTLCVFVLHFERRAMQSGSFQAKLEWLDLFLCQASLLFAHIGLTVHRSFCLAGDKKTLI